MRINNNANNKKPNILNIKKIKNNINFFKTLDQMIEINPNY